MVLPIGMPAESEGTGPAQALVSRTGGNEADSSESGPQFAGEEWPDIGLLPGKGGAKDDLAVPQDAASCRPAPAGRVSSASRDSDLGVVGGNSSSKVC